MMLLCSSFGVLIGGYVGDHMNRRGGGGGGGGGRGLMLLFDMS